VAWGALVRISGMSELPVEAVDEVVIRASGPAVVLPLRRDHGLTEADRVYLRETYGLVDREVAVDEVEDLLTRLRSTPRDESQYISHEEMKRRLGLAL
jgi:hypothetical protein